MLTAHPTRILGRPDHGLAPGRRADLAIWDTGRPLDIVAALTPCRLVTRADG